MVGLFPLSDRVPARIIARALARALRDEHGGGILLVELSRASSRLSLEAWHHRSPARNAGFLLGKDLEDAGLDVPLLTVQTRGPADPERSLPALLEHCGQHFRHVVVHAAHDVILPTTLECMRAAGRVFLLGAPREEDFYQRELLLQDPLLAARLRPQTFRSVLCLESGASLARETLRQYARLTDAKVHNCPAAESAAGLNHWPDGPFNADIRRLAREIAGSRVGLALSSGGARGLSHIGVIQVLEENGIEIDAIAGCSMGSYVGAVWAYGFDGAAMERLAREVEHPWGLFELIDPFLLPRQGFLKGEKVKLRLKRTIGDIHFEELIRPLRIVATHLGTLDRVVFSSGEVAAAVHASSAIPGACVPVVVNGEPFIDGGIADPLPIDVLEEMGIEKIIAVNTIPTPDYLRAHQALELERKARLGRRAGKVRTFVNRYLNYFAPGNVLDTILRSFNGAQMQVAEHSCLFADLVLRPLSLDGRWHDFRRPGKYIAIGRREAEQHLDEIKSLIQRKEPAHEALASHHSLVAPA